MNRIESNESMRDRRRRRPARRPRAKTSDPSTTIAVRSVAGVDARERMHASNRIESHRIASIHPSRPRRDGLLLTSHDSREKGHRKTTRGARPVVDFVPRSHCVPIQTHTPRVTTHDVHRHVAPRVRRVTTRRARGPTRGPARAETTGRETTTGDRSIGIRFTRARDSVGGGLGR